MMLRLFSGVMIACVVGVQLAQASLAEKEEIESYEGSLGTRAMLKRKESLQDLLKHSFLSANDLELLRLKNELQALSQKECPLTPKTLKRKAILRFKISQRMRR